jgi:hypothetical protein
MPLVLHLPPLEADSEASATYSSLTTVLIIMRIRKALLACANNIAMLQTQQSTNNRQNICNITHFSKQNA